MDPLEQIVITSPFGWRIHPTLKVPRYHTGIDLRSRTPKKAFAINDAIVYEISYDVRNPYGKYILLQHTDRYLSFYAHLSEICVAVGEKVVAGQVIGLTGNTGKYTTGPHLHFGVTSGSTIGTKDWIDPLAYLTKIKEEEQVEKNEITLIKKDGTKIELDGSIYKGTSLTPVRALSEALGCKVDYDTKTKQVVITEG